MTLQSTDALAGALSGSKLAKHFVLVVPDGVGIRNFLYSKYLDLILEHGSAAVWHTLPEATVAPFRERWEGRLDWEALPYSREGLDERVLRQAKIIAQLKWQRGPGADAVLKRLTPKGRLPGRLVGHLAHALGAVFGSRAGTQRLDRWHARISSRPARLAPYIEFLSRARPSCVFCTHQRSSRAVPAMLAARQLGIPTATFIYSWDNLPKGRMAVHSDAFLVWGPSMAEELSRYYPEVDPERIHRVGTPQFEHYFNESLVEPRASFLERHGLDPRRTVLCFSGDDVTTSPHDPSYLADLARAVRSMPEGERPQILFRRCPVDSSGRYDAVLAEFPEVALSEPLWYSPGEGDWTGSVPSPEDVALLVNVARHCDAVINLGSTMAMDFATLGKPGIYFDYNQPDLQDGWDVHEVYRLPHFRSVHELQPVHWVRDSNEWVGVIREALRQPDGKAGARRSWLELHVESPPDQASRRCVEAVLSLCKASHS